MPQYKILNQTPENFEKLALISHSLRICTKAHDKAKTICVKHKIKKELKYWESRMDYWLDENTEKVK